MKARLPGFLIDTSLSSYGRPYYSVLSHDAASVSKIIPARIVCPTTALGATCTALQAPEWLFPCFGNEQCGLFFATLKFPACASCRVV